jgi:hypothetical protein
MCNFNFKTANPYQFQNSKPLTNHTQHCDRGARHASQVLLPARDLCSVSRACAADSQGKHGYKYYDYGCEAAIKCDNIFPS